MKAVNQTKSKNSQAKANQFVSNPIFNKSNYLWMIIGVVIITIGMLLMIGGKSKDPNVFLENEIYSFRRITLSPILIVAGFIIEIYAILKTDKSGSQN